MTNIIISFSVMVILFIFLILGLDYYFNKVHKGRVIDTIIGMILMVVYFFIMMIVLNKIDDIFPA